MTAALPFPALLRAFAREHTSPPGVLSLVGEEKRPGEPPTSEGDPDLELVMAARNGDYDAFEKIVRKYQGNAFNIALRMLSDREEARDLTQDVFIKVYRSLGTFRSESRFAHWFYAVLLNTCRSRLKHLKRRGFFISEPLDDPREDDKPPRQHADLAPGAEEILEKKQMEELVQEKMKLVPEEFREALVLRDIQGFAYEEIAEVLGLNIGTVKSRLHRGRMIMKDLLAGSLEGIK